jgi:MFS transporter, DHA1 family, multidrug resistance protein
MVSWKRTYWVVWTANLVTAVGMMSFLPFFPGHLQALGLEDPDQVAAWAGAIFGAAPLAAAVMTPIWAALGDRFGRRLMAVRAMLGICLFVGAMALATQPWHLFLLRLGQGAFAGFIAPSITLVSVVAPSHRQGEITGSLQTALAIGAVIGPVIGGLVVPTLGMEMVFLGVSVASVASAALVWLLAQENSEHRQSVTEKMSPGSVLLAGVSDLRAVLALPRLRSALILVFWMILGAGATSPLLQIFVEELGTPPGQSERWTGYLVSTFAAVHIVAMPLWGRYGDRRGFRTALQRCSSLGVVALFLHAATPNLAVLFGARVLLGVAMAGLTPLAYGLAATEVAVERRGGAIGAVFSARTLAISISAILGGVLSQYLGLRGLFILGGVLLLAARIFPSKAVTGD